MLPTVLSSQPPLIKVEKIFKHYDEKEILKDISFEIKPGEIVGFLGPNGAGKTTVLRVLSGFFPPTSGQVLIKGKPMAKDPRLAKRSIGYLPETVNLYPDMRVAEYLSFVAKLKDVERSKIKTHIEEKMYLCGLCDMGKKLIGQLSKGYRQRIGLTQALIGDPDVLILDEPTTGLDPTQIKGIRDVIESFAATRAVILSTHILSEVSVLCNRVMMIDHGSILANGTVRELSAFLKNKDNIQICLKNREKENEARDLLKSLNIKKMLVLAEPTGELFFSFQVATEEDLRPRIAKMFVERDIPLVEIRRRAATLEDIFMYLLEVGELGDLKK